jgi:hypothetical protein
MGPLLAIALAYYVFLRINREFGMKHCVGALVMLIVFAICA